MTPIGDPSSRYGLRDRAMLHIAYAGGLRVSELIGLHLTDLVLHPQPTIHVMGKGRRERVLPLWKETAKAVRDWLKVRGDPKSTALFPNARGDGMTRSGFEYILEKHVRTASAKQPSMANKQVSPHSMRHSCAMHTLQATGDIRKVALWLGHASLQSTEVYLRADPTEKLEAMASLVPPTLRRGHFRPPDKLLAMLRPKQ
jgi:integrase/recombinase XerD